MTDIVATAESEAIATSIELHLLDNAEESKQTDDNPIMTLPEPALSILPAFDENAKLYESINWRLLSYWIHLWIIFILYRYVIVGCYLGISKCNTASVAAIIIHLIDIIAHIIVLLVAYRKSRKGDNTFSHFNDTVNEMLGIKKKDPKNVYNLSAISGHYVGIIFCVIWINVNSLMIVNRAWAMSLNVSGGLSWGGATNSPIVIPSTNTVFFTSIGSTFAILVTKFYVINDEIVKNMLEHKDEKILGIKDGTIRIGQELNKLIYEDALVQWQQSLYPSNRKGSAFSVHVPTLIALRTHNLDNII